MLASIHSSYDDNSAVVGTNKAYAALHQNGANISVGAHSRLFAQNRFTAGKNKGRFNKGVNKSNHGSSYKARAISIPARPFLVLTEEDWTKLKNEVYKYVTNG